MSFTTSTQLYEYLARVGLGPLKIIKNAVVASGATSVFFRTLGDNRQSFDALRHHLL